MLHQNAQQEYHSLISGRRPGSCQVLLGIFDDGLLKLGHAVVSLKPRLTGAGCLDFAEVHHVALDVVFSAVAMGEGRNLYPTPSDDKGAWETFGGILFNCVGHRLDFLGQPTSGRRLFSSISCWPDCSTIPLISSNLTGDCEFSRAAGKANHRHERQILGPKNSKSAHARPTVRGFN